MFNARDIAFAALIELEQVAYEFAVWKDTSPFGTRKPSTSLNLWQALNGA